VWRSPVSGSRIISAFAVVPARDEQRTTSAGDGGHRAGRGSGPRPSTALIAAARSPVCPTMSALA